MLDTKALAETTADIVRKHVEKATSPLLERIAALEAREIPVVPDIEPLIARAVEAIPTPRDGKDVEPESVAEMVRGAVASALSDLPRPADGKSVTLEEIRPLVSAAVEEAIGNLPAAKDGVGVAGALIDRTGALVITLSDGTTRDLGCVVGRDADEVAIRRQITDAVAAMPTPKDGADGFGFDDMTFEHDGARGFTLRFVKGERVKEFPFEVPMVLDQGVYRAGETYAKGDAVTWAGSLWIAQKETQAKPDGGEDWRLAVKRGRDGRSN